MPQCVLDAAFNVVSDYPGGAASLAPRIDKAASTLTQEVNGTPQAKLGLATAVKITQRTGDLRILLAFAGACGQMLLPLPEGLDVDDDDCMRAATSAAREFGELMTEVMAARADGRTTDNELDRVTRSTGELMRALHQLNAAFVASNMAGKPAAVRAS
ncbi:phage regulatory CII family protein [Pseudorhodoferax sp. Leaf274]|uniref:phage regulatory CII family protein n=1 Tax=Pseudorhodoferax sp. Leaf274 TaxID=1736318 RepID=UPI000702FF39|nr:phage regulatory CII family protein [Pseudorhodoferax sp. Leaf274]KQP37569.1 hypothetical protein ASF44_14600 [Pseudorhodoferax sp. Leaf274]